MLSRRHRRQLSRALVSRRHITEHFTAPEGGKVCCLAVDVQFEGQRPEFRDRRSDLVPGETCTTTNRCRSPGLGLRWGLIAVIAVTVFIVVVAAAGGEQNGTNDCQPAKDLSPDGPVVVPTLKQGQGCHWDTVPIPQLHACRLLVRGISGLAVEILGTSAPIRPATGLRRPSILSEEPPPTRSRTPRRRR
jgi:hypothetical protein